MRFRVVLFGGWLESPSGGMSGLKLLGQKILQRYPASGVSYLAHNSSVGNIVVERYRVTEDEQRDYPLVLGGFSYGATAAYLLTKYLLDQGRSVKLLGIFDGVPDWSRGLKQSKCFVVPSNVQRAVSYRRTGLRMLPPWSCEFRNPSDYYINIGIPTSSHEGPPSSEDAHADFMHRMLY
jgi:hypothetical protein